MAEHSPKILASEEKATSQEDIALYASPDARNFAFSVHPHVFPVLFKCNVKCREW